MAGYTRRMKMVGVDYGSKRVGVAVSDDAGRIAFPKMTLPNNRALLADLVAFIKKEGAVAVVLGESRSLVGGENPIMADIRRFAAELSEASQVPVHFEPELFSSVEARTLSGKEGAVDAGAAAIILQSYLAKHNTYDDFA